MISTNSLKAGARQGTAFFATFFIFGFFLLFLGKSPVLVFKDLYVGAFGSIFSLKNTFTQAAPLMLVALCTLIPAQLGIVVIGNEGALLIGGLAAAVTGPLLAGMAPGFAIVLMALSAMLAGGLWIAMAGILKQYKGVDITISSLLFYYIGLSIFLFLVEGPLRDPLTLNKPSTVSIPDVLKVGLIPGLGVHYGFLAGILICLGVFLFLRYTPTGFAIRVVGSNHKAALLLGLPVNRYVILCCFAGGAFAGLAGFYEVTAIHFNANAALKGGVGFAGILVAFAARQNALSIIPVSLLLGGVEAAGGILQRRHQLSDATMDLFQGILFLSILACEGLIIFDKKRRALG